MPKLAPFAMLSIIQFIAVLSTTLFAGAATYITIAEHPARMSWDTKTAATIWAPSYHRAAPTQATLALIGSIAGVGAWFVGSNPAWLAGAILIGAVIPFTLVMIAPLNRRLLDPRRDLTSNETRLLLKKWGKRHAVRSLLGLNAAIIYVGLSVVPEFQLPYGLGRWIT
jgi:hypothetical protein